MGKLICRIFSIGILAPKGDIVILGLSRDNLCLFVAAEYPDRTHLDAQEFQNFDPVLPSECPTAS